MLLWDLLGKFPGTDYETFNWEWILKTVKDYTEKVDDFTEDMTDAWNAFKNVISHEIAEMHRKFAIYVNVTEEALNTGAIANGAITFPKLSSALQTHVNAIIPVSDYESLVTNGDWTTAVQTATDENDLIYIDKDIEIYGTVNIPEDHTILIGAYKVEKPVDATNDDPIFYLGYNYASLIGTGTATVIRSYRPSPDGVVKIGAESNTTITRTVVYCRVQNLTIHGAANANDNIGLHLCGTFDTVNYYASYFHFVSDLVIHTCAMGIVFNNAANANIVNNIQFRRCGYSRTTGAFCFIRTQGAYSAQFIPLENVINNAFHHESSNATTLYFGTAIGYNRIDGIVAEQGGTDAHIYVVNQNEPSSQMRNVIKFTSNVVAGWITTDDFVANNTIEATGRYRTRVVDTELLTVNGIEARPTDAQEYELRNVEGLYENTEYSIGTLPARTISGYSTYICEIIACTNCPGLPIMNRYVKSSYEIKMAGVGASNMTVTEIDSSGTLDLTVSTGGAIRMKTPNNGTGTHNTEIKIYVKLSGWVPAGGTIAIDDAFNRVN